MNRPRSVTAALMGDPPPGRAAGPPPPPQTGAPRYVPPVAEMFDEGHAPERMKSHSEVLAGLAPKAPVSLSGFKVKSGPVELHDSTTPAAAESTARNPLSYKENGGDVVDGNTGSAADAPIAKLAIALRPVAALDQSDKMSVWSDIPTPPPTVEWMAPSDLLIDEAYQRALSDKSKALIRKIVEGWDWRRMKPPIIAWTENGFEIIDGQHTAIAAATRGIEKIPVLVIEAGEVAHRALAFVGHNTDRLAVSAMQLHVARAAAGDEDAVTINQVCARAGVKLVVSMYGGRPWKPGESQAIAAISWLIGKRGAKRAREILELLAEAGCAPVTANQIKAIDHLTEPEFEERLERWADGGRDNLLAAITALGVKAEEDATINARQLCIPKWKALAGVYFKKTRKRRTP